MTGPEFVTPFVGVTKAHRRSVKRPGEGEAGRDSRRAAG